MLPLPRSWAMLAAMLVSAVTATGQEPREYQWLLPSTGPWSNPDHWQHAAVPGTGHPGDSALIGQGAGSGGTAVVDAHVPTLGRWFLGGSQAGSSGNLEVRDGGELTTTGQSANAIGIAGMGTLTVTGGQVTMVARLDVDNGTVTHSGGTVRLTDPSVGTLLLGLGGQVTARYLLAGDGELDAAAQVLIGFGGIGEFTQTGGTVRAREVVVGTGGEGNGVYLLAGGALRPAQGLAIGRGGIGTLRIVGDEASIVTGAFSVAEASNLELKIDGGITAVETATPANLTGGALHVEFLTQPLVGSKFTLIQTGGDSPTATQFIDKPQGALFSAVAPQAPVRLQLSYVANVDGGATANDVVVTTLPADLILGDVDLDGDVDRHDFQAIVRGLGRTANSTWLDGDLTGDGRVSLADLLVLRANLGQVQPVGSPTAVPEPTSDLLLTALLAAVCAVRTIYASGRSIYCVLHVQWSRGRPAGGRKRVLSRRPAVHYPCGQR